MDDNKQNFLFYNSWWDIIHEEYKDENERKELIYAICKYGRTGEKTYPLEKMFLKQAYIQIELAKEKHEKRVEAGRRGGKAGTGDNKKRLGNKNASKTQANVNDNDNDNVKDNVNISLSYKYDNENNAPIGIGSLKDPAKALTTKEQLRLWSEQNGV